MPVRTVTLWDLSTGHLSEDERSILDQTRENDLIVRIIEHRHGWLVPIGSGGDIEDRQEVVDRLLAADLPSLATIYVSAAAHGVQWLNFDVDAQVSEDFTNHDQSES